MTFRASQYNIFPTQNGQFLKFNFVRKSGAKVSIFMVKNHTVQHNSYLTISDFGLLNVFFNVQ